MDKFDELGYTSHHSKAQIAFKFYDDVFLSTVRDIDWTVGKTVKQINLKPITKLSELNNKTEDNKTMKLDEALIQFEELGFIK